MRYIIIILVTMLLGACGNKLNNIKYAGEKVKQTVNACAEATINVCPDVKKCSVKEDEQTKEGIDPRASTTWDTHMMLW